MIERLYGRYYEELLRWCAGMTENVQTAEELPEPEGAIFAMRYLEGYRSREIGEIFGILAGTVRFKLSSARKHIKEILGGNKDVG